MPTETATGRPTRGHYLLAAVAVCLYAVVVLRTAWLSDDAYITFRTVDNFVGGYGLTWNVAERVQAYTHPLWMFLLSGCYQLTHEIYYTSIVLGVAFSAATVLFLAARVAVGVFPALVAVAVFTLSKAFVDYSTSGLENPLTHLLLALFLFVYLTRPANRKTLLWLSLLAGLLTFNRMDAVLLVLPALCVAFYRARGLPALGTVVVGLTPFLAWEAFALFYYGSPLPNTAYAKLNNGIAAGELIRQGLLYLLASLRLDPLTPIVIVAGLAAPLLTRQRRHLPLGLGAALYLAYVVWIGGDFMLGRFLTVPLLIAVVLLSQAAVSSRVGLLMFLVVGIIGAMPPRSPLSSGKDYGATSGILVDKHGVCDERGYYYQGTGLLLADRGGQWPDHSYARQGRRPRECGERVVVAKCIGMFGFFAGPEVHVVDELALADPLLARLEPLRGRQWRPGHYHRRIPQGYVQTLRTGQNMLADPQLAEYYDKLRFITRGPLWDSHRWSEIVKFNLGAYDDLLAAAQPQSP